MTEETKKIVLPAYVIRRLEAFRIVKGDAQSYLLRDKLHGKTFDFDAWQFFILEVLPGCDTVEKLQSVFKDRFDRDITIADLEHLFGTMADNKLWDESALQHPLLAVYAKRTYDVVDGKAVLRSHAENTKIPGTGPMPAKSPEKKAEAAALMADLPAGVQDAVGLDPRTMKKMIDLFDPRPILRVIAPVLAPLRFLGYLLPAMLLLAVMLVVRNWQFLIDDLHTLHIEMSLGAHLLFSLLTVNLTATLMRACIAYIMGAQVERWGIIFFVGFIPRFEIGIRGLDNLSRRQRMWFHGSNLLLRIFILCCAIFVWYSTRNDMTGLVHEGALAMILTAWASLILETGNPFMRASTYFLLSAYLDEPHLRGKAHKALMNKLHGGVYQKADSTILAIYALACATYITVLTVFLAIGLGAYLLHDLKMGGIAILITALIIAMLLWRNYTTLKKYGDAYERQAQFDRWRKRTLLAAGQAEGEVVEKKTSYWWLAILLCLSLVLLLPYSYQPSGSFTIYPARKQVISTDTPGLIDKVFFDGGETLKAGTVLAQLSHDDYQAQINILTAKIAEQQATLDNLKTLPKPEQVKLAQSLLEVQRRHEQFSRDKAPRLEKLYNIGAVSFEEYDTARKEHEVDMQQVLQREAELALVKAPVTADEIEAAEAKLNSLKAERADYEAKVTRTVLKMPFDGNILTLHLMDRTNSYLDKGQPFASIEYTGVVTAQIEVAESDLQYIKIGNLVHVRPNAYFNREFTGKVALIDPNITTKPTGTYVYVLVTVDNPEGKLKTAMSGEAKIDGVTIPVWEAFTQAVVRFFTVQVWSWIP
jgi:putative peptide zinc metalloprotease protein